MNKALREELLSPYFVSDETGDIRHFEKLPSEVVQKLIDNGFFKTSDWTGYSGEAEILDFLEAYPDWTAHGYVISWDRYDTRITLEGLEKMGDLEKQEIIDFATTFHAADEIQLTPRYGRCWYD